MLINAYVLAADPAYLAASVQSYYGAVSRIVVSYDEEHRSFSGERVPIDECLEELRAVDPDRKLDPRPGSFSRPELGLLEVETLQRQAALDAASEDADWVLQIDSDEVVADLPALVAMVQRADSASAAGLDFPSRWLYAELPNGRFLEASTRFWRPAAGYPGPLAVKAGTRLRLARQCEGTLFRVDFRSSSTDPWRPTDAPVDATIPVDSAVLHFSWVRTPEELAMKAAINSHRDDTDWAKEIATWQFRQRHPRLAVAATPLRRRGKLHPNWLRTARLPVRAQSRLGRAQ